MNSLVILKKFDLLHASCFGDAIQKILLNGYNCFLISLYQSLEVVVLCTYLI